MEALRRTIVLGLLPIALLAQPIASPPPAEMKKLGWWVGEWKGEGWAEMGPDGRSAFSIHERVQWKLDGRLLLVEGRGKSKLPGKQVEVDTHQALGVVSYDPKAQKLRFYAWRDPGGMQTEADFKVTDGGMEWGFQTPQGHIRFTIRRTEKGEWLEIGERSLDGASWRQFLQMTLQRVQE